MAATKSNINFNIKHLRKGDPMPPYTGKLRIYNMRFCPFAHRTMLTLIAKGIDFEIVNVALADKPEWLTSKSPLGKVPALEIKEGVVLYESLVTAEYLDEVYPQRPLVHKDPFIKAFDKIILEVFTCIPAMSSKGVRGTLISEEDVTAFNKALQFIQDQLISRGTKYLDGSEPGFVDYMIWPWFERLPAFENDERFNINPQKFGKLLEYLKNMRKDPIVTKYLVPKEVFQKVFEGYRTVGKPDYDKCTALLSQ